MRSTSLILIVLLIGACGEMKKEENKLSILKYALTKYIPSASGVEYYAGNLIITGDDAPYLFYLNEKDWSIHKEYQIAIIDSMIGNRMYYKTKPDFEGITSLSINGYNHHIVVGSGSKQVKRDTCIIFDDGKRRISTKVNFRPLYEAFMDSLSEKGKRKINIEGIAANDEKVFFAHRGSVYPPNAIFEMKTSDFVAFIQSNGTNLPKFKTYRYELPVVQGESAGLSGLDIIEGVGLLASASIEVTNDPTRDGEILGSFIGLIPFDKLSQEKPKFSPVLKDGKALITKIESVSIKKATKEKIRFIAVSDNDDGSSEIFEMELNGL